MPVIFFLIFSIVSHAQQTDWQKSFADLCRPLANSRAQVAAIADATCKEQMKAANCEQYFIDNDIELSDRNDCSLNTMDAPMLLPLMWFSSCPSGLMRGFFDDDLVSAAVEAAYDQFRQTGALEPGSLERKHARAEKYRQALRDQVDFIALPYAEKRRLFDEAQVLVNHSVASKKIIENTLQSSKVALYCYHPSKQIELSCYGAALAASTYGTAAIGKSLLVGGAKKAAMGVEKLKALVQKAAGLAKRGN